MTVLDDSQVQQVIESWRADSGWSATCPICGRKLPHDPDAEVGQFRECHCIPVVEDIECAECGWRIQIEALYVLPADGHVTILERGEML